MFPCNGTTSHMKQQLENLNLRKLQIRAFASKYNTIFWNTWEKRKTMMAVFQFSPPGGFHKFSGTSKSSILLGFSLITQAHLGGTPIYPRTTAVVRLDIALDITPHDATHGHATGRVKKLTTSEPREHFTMGVTNSRRKPSQCSSPGNQCLAVIQGRWISALGDGEKCTLWSTNCLL